MFRNIHINLFFTTGPHMRDLGLILPPNESYWCSASSSFWQKSRKLLFIHENIINPENNVSNTVSGIFKHVQGDIVTKPLPKYTSRPEVSISALYILIYPHTFLIFPYMIIYPGGSRFCFLLRYVSPRTVNYKAKYLLASGTRPAHHPRSFTKTVGTPTGGCGNAEECENALVR